MTPFTALISAHQRRQLRDLNEEHRDTLEALNHAQASITRAQKLHDQNYHRKRKAILAKGHTL